MRLWVCMLLIVMASRAHAQAESASVSVDQLPKAERDALMKALNEAALKDARAAIPGAPLTDDQVRQIVTEMKRRQRAERPIDPPSAARAAVYTISLDPGATAPRITLNHNFTTAIDIIDQAGNPWPVANPIVGDATAVTLSGPIGRKKEPSHQLMVTPAAPFAVTNLVLPLVSGDRPISVVLQNDDAMGGVIHDRITLIVQGRGPNTAPDQPVDAAIPVNDLRDMLTGQPPSDAAVPVLVGSGDQGIMGWRDRQHKTLWIRGPVSAVSPAPTAVVTYDDIHAMRLPYLPVIVVKDREGDMQTLTLTDIGRGAKP